MPERIGHRGHIRSPHLYQATQGVGETGQVGSKVVRKAPGEIHNAFLRSGAAHFGERNPSPGIQERSVEQRAHVRQVKNPRPLPELHQGKNPRPLPELHQAPRPLPPKLRVAPLGLGTLSTGSGIDVLAPWLTQEARLNLENNYDISITPVRVCGKEIGYVFGQSRSDVGKIYLSCHGNGRNQVDFEKPVGVALKFIAPNNHRLFCEPSETENVAKGDILYKEKNEQIYAADSKKNLKNYYLSGFEPDTVRDFLHADSINCAKDVQDLKNKGTPINLMVLNPYAEGIHLKDVIQGVNDTFHRMPELILSHCRGENENAKGAYPLYKKSEDIEKTRDPEFISNSEKRMAGDWTDKIHSIEYINKR
ncbi:hypothetical protein NW381_001355 [Salmonella enterica]|nr:hypothetical protein [Salmonella enterica]EJS3009951.1 hypothetical protein [Salmonella enterica]EJS3014554.1 hypothetical protein [Salmonella enterica]